MFPNPGQNLPQTATHQIIDPFHQGMVVATLDHPAQWRAQSLVRWNFRNHNNLAVMFAIAYNPQGAEAFEVFPRENFYWSQWGAPAFGGADAYTIVVGSARYGAVAQPPMQPPDVMAQIVIAKHRGDRAGLRILGMQAMPQLAQLLNRQDLMGVQHQGITARIAYAERGMAIEEEFYACVYILPDSGGQLNWGIMPIMSIRAQAGALDAARQQYWWMAQSIRPNPQWQALYANLANQLHSQQAQALYAARQEQLAQDARLSQQMSDYFNWHHDMENSLATMREQSDAGRREDFGNLMMGRTPYDDPSSSTGQPHYDYQHAPHVWTDGQGNWQHSDDPNFDPNINSSVTWSRARPPGQK